MYVKYMFNVSLNDNPYGTNQWDCISILDTFVGKLTNAAPRLLNSILGQPTEYIFVSGSELAERAHIQQSATVRLVHKLDFIGYP